MLKRHDLIETPTLFELLSHPEVYPFVRHKADTLDTFYFMMKQTIEAENNDELFSRTILNEYSQPIGMISLYDVQENYGFLATWIGKPYFGMGYNRLAKEEFFDELFFTHNIETIFLKVRTTNHRSYRAVMKLPYAILGNSIYQDIYDKVNSLAPTYNIFAITKKLYNSYKQLAVQPETNEEVI